MNGDAIYQHLINGRMVDIRSKIFVSTAGRCCYRYRFDSNQWVDIKNARFRYGADETGWPTCGTLGRAKGKFEDPPAETQNQNPPCNDPAVLRSALQLGIRYLDHPDVRAIPFALASECVADRFRSLVGEGSAAPPPENQLENRLELLVWRKFNDDDDTLDVCPFGADEKSDLVEAVAADYGLEISEDEMPGSMIVTSRMTIKDGEIIPHGNRSFRIRIEEIDPPVCPVCEESLEGDSILSENSDGATIHMECEPLDSSTPSDVPRCGALFPGVRVVVKGEEEHTTCELPQGHDGDHRLGFMQWKFLA